MSEDELTDQMAEEAVSWTDDYLAGKIVELLILDKGVVNAWERTVRLMITIIQKRERIIAQRGQASG